MELSKRDDDELRYYDEYTKRYAGLKDEDFLVDEKSFLNKGGSLSLIYHRTIEAMGDIRGKKILDYGCGNGRWAVYFAKRGAITYAFDLSPAFVEITKKRQRINQVNINCEVMRAQKLDYPDDFFDVVWGVGILHHLDILEIRDELYRVLRRGGKAYFFEYYEVLRLIHFLQELRHALFLQGEPGIYGTLNERPLNDSDIAILSEPFSRTEVKRHRLVARFIDKILESPEIRWWTAKFDDFVLTKFPFLGNMGSDCSIVLEK